MLILDDKVEGMMMDDDDFNECQIPSKYSDGENSDLHAEFPENIPRVSEADTAVLKMDDWLTDVNSQLEKYQDLLIELTGKPQREGRGLGVRPKV